MAEAAPRQGGFPIIDKLRLSAAVLEQSLFQLLLAFDAVARPGNCFQALGVDLLATGDALTKVSFANTVKRTIDHLQQLPVIVALMEEEFLVVRVGGAISDVLGRFQIGVPAVLRGASHGVAQLTLTILQSLSESFESLFLHRSVTLLNPALRLSWPGGQKMLCVNGNDMRGEERTSTAAVTQVGQ